MYNKSIRKFKPSDKELFITMADEFYHSPAVLHPVPIQTHENIFNEIMRSDCYLCGYIFELAGEPAGYAVTAKSFSTEAGGVVIWIEDVYIRPQFRSKGLGKMLFEELEKNSDPKLKRLRLEVEEDNVRAVSLYENLGFKRLPYSQMIKDF